MIFNTFLFSEVHLCPSATPHSWLDSVLGKQKQRVFLASFEGVNNTVLELNDGDNASIDCKVFLK
jgi:hypothetical protein